jgi:hypothetical protein
MLSKPVASDLQGSGAGERDQARFRVRLAGAVFRAFGVLGAFAFALGLFGFATFAARARSAASRPRRAHGAIDSGSSWASSGGR